jgi:hypothetical protein
MLTAPLAVLYDVYCCMMQHRTQEVFDRLGALTKTKVNWEPSDAARDSAMAKISKEAAFYDRNRSK